MKRISTNSATVIDSKVRSTTYLPVRLLSIFFALLAGVFVLVSCDDTLEAPADKLPAFSKDTLSFDTVFTSIGSATAKVLVYNRLSKPVTIDRLQLAGGSASPFRINVDGFTNKEHLFESITIRAKDSMYIFVEVTVNPQQSNAPVLMRDSIVITTSEGRKRMLLEAYGQNVRVLRSLIVASDSVLDATLPYLIKGDLVVDTMATLRLAPGVRLYFHHNSNLMVYGHLKAEGTFEQPISIRGDRLDKIGFVTPVPYNLVAGQWGGVYLVNPRGNHVLKHVNINSGYVGVYYVNQSKVNKPKLEIVNCRIQNFLFYNIVAINGDMKVSNSAITNSGGYTVYLNGGKHEFYHCTIANYFSNSEVQSVNRDKAPAFMMMSLPRSFPMETKVINSVIAGSSLNEISLASRYDSLYNATITHSYLKRTSASQLPFYKNIVWSTQKDTLFKSIREDLPRKIQFNFMPDSVSPLRKAVADPTVAVQFPIDLNGRSRLADGVPDAGAFEWVPDSI